MPQPKPTKSTAEPGPKPEHGPESHPHEPALNQPASVKSSSSKLELQTLSEVYESIAELPFKVRNGPQTCFDHRKKEVVIGVQQLKDLGIKDQAMVDFIVLHELGHFQELAHDPAGYQSVINEGKRADGLGRAYFGFYNSLMDIYVNTNSRNRAPVYSDGSGEFSQEVKEMYRENLFADRDFTKLPLSKQYGYYLLNVGMGVHTDITLSPEVKTAIDQGVNYLGEKLTYQDIINDYLVPAIGRRNSETWRATISERKFVIDQALRPIFEKLLKTDLERGRDPTQSEPGELEGIEASPEDLEGAINEVIRRNEEASKSDEQRASEDRKKAAEELAKRDLTPEEAKDFAETFSRVEAHAYELAALFLSLRSNGADFKKVSIGHFKTGSTLDMRELVPKFDKLQSLPSETRVMKRDIYQRINTSSPHEIRLWLVPDLSGSMDGDIKLLKDVAVTFAIALQTLSNGVKLGQHAVEGSLGIVGYNSELVSILPLKTGISLTDVIKSYKFFNADGGTVEHLALDSICEQMKRDPPNSDRVDIVVGITDGDTSEPEKSKQCIKEFSQLGAKLCAFKFSRGYVRPDVMPDPGKVTPEELFTERAAAQQQKEKDTFKDIWGEHGKYVRGADGVLGAMKGALRELLERGG